jgi:hypothetical protein
VPLEQVEEFRLEFVNRGKALGEVTIVKDPRMGSSLVLSPTKFSLAPGKGQTVKLSITGRECKANKFICEVKINRRQL